MTAAITNNKTVQNQKLNNIDKFEFEIRKPAKSKSGNSTCIYIDRPLILDLGIVKLQNSRTQKFNGPTAPNTSGSFSGWRQYDQDCYISARIGQDKDNEGFDDEITKALDNFETRMLGILKQANYCSQDIDKITGLPKLTDMLARFVDLKWRVDNYHPVASVVQFWDVKQHRVRAADNAYVNALLASLSSASSDTIKREATRQVGSSVLAQVSCKVNGFCIYSNANKQHVKLMTSINSLIPIMNPTAKHKSLFDGEGSVPVEQAFVGGLAAMVAELGDALGTLDQRTEDNLAQPKKKSPKKQKPRPKEVREEEDSTDAEDRLQMEEDDEEPAPIVGTRGKRGKKN